MLLRLASGDLADQLQADLDAIAAADRALSGADRPLPD